VRWPFGKRQVWYAQHGEDRRLDALLAGRKHGFYIDVGAWQPVQDSVTKYFYDRGWRGVNVEPHPGWAEVLRRERPRDVTLQVALGDAPGEQTLTVIGRTGLSTFDAALADQAEGWIKENRPQPAVVERVTVPVVTLAQVCREHVPPGAEIDFLKVDVEGWEERVLRGGDWERFRPRIVVVEAVAPLSDVPAWEAWDEFVRERGYAFLEFDGLNRWYRRDDARGAAST
jgi:FkbM family methyltransferase